MSHRPSFISRSIGVRASVMTLISFSLISCDESTESKRERSARFTTTSSVAPNPEREPLEDLVRRDLKASDSLRASTQFPLFSNYAGQGLRHVREVSGRSVLLCIEAKWCPFSKKMRRDLKALAENEKGTLQVIMLDADTYPNIARNLKISKLPYSFLYVEGLLLRARAGAHPYDEMKHWFHQALLSQDEEPPMVLD